MEGNGVRRAQYLLREKGFDIEPDHIFGPIVGPLTWRSLAGSPMQPPGSSG